MFLNTFRIVTNLREALDMDLLGIDVIIDSNTGKYGIIDVNAFPSKLTFSYFMSLY